MVWCRGISLDSWNAAVLGASIMHRTFCTKCPTHAQFYTCLISSLASQCARHCSDDWSFADSGEMCSGIVTLGPGTGTDSGTGKTGLIHVLLTDQEVTLCNHKIYCLWFLTSLMNENPCLIQILKFCEKWREHQLTLTLIFNPLKVLQTQIKNSSKGKWTHYNTVKFKTL